MKTTININLNAIEYNFRKLKEIVLGQEIIPVIKADAYGTGATIIAKFLKTIGCEKFFCATIDEGIVLRKVLKNEIIYILNGVATKDEGKELVAHNLTPVLNSIYQTDIWLYMSKKNIQQSNAAIQFDIGLNRLGIKKEELEFLDKRIRTQNNLNIDFIMAHLTNSFDKIDKNNYIQLNKFIKIRNGYLNKKASLISTNGIFLGREFLFDIVRIGIGLLGYLNSERISKLYSFKPAIKIESFILDIKKVGIGERVGYGSGYIAKTNLKIATIQMGFADGLSSLFSNKAYVYISEHKIPILGYISTDLASIDVTKVPTCNIYVGAKVTVAHDNNSLKELSEITKMSIYEILIMFCNGKRTSKLYNYDGGIIT